MSERAVTIVRWIARVWTIPIFLVALAIVLTPDPNVMEPVPLTDWIESSFYGVAILGLLLAWRWERLGGATAIAGVLGHQLAFRVFRGYWMLRLGVAPFGLALVFVAPGVLFLVCWVTSRKRRQFRTAS